MRPDVISFPNGNIPAVFSQRIWTAVRHRAIEFFPGLIAPVRVISVNDAQFPAALRDLVDGYRFALDIEWQPDLDPESANLPSVFQIASSRGVLVIQHPVNQLPNRVLRTFLTEHRFYSKGMFMDRVKLRARFGPTFPLDQFEDIEETLLRPNQFSVNYQKMLETWAPESCAPFKDRKIQLSDWSRESLTVSQVLYAAFDVVALRLVNYNIRTLLAERRAAAFILPEQITVHSSPMKCSEKCAKKRPVSCRRIPRQNSISVRSRNPRECLQ
jgi:hypothetical protein